MDQFVVRDPGNRADQEADDINRETRRQTPQRLNHSRIVEISSCVFQVDIEDEQRNREGDYTVAERFDSALGHGATLFKLLKRNLTHGHRTSWHRPCEITGIPLLVQHVNLAVSLTSIAKESASIFRIMRPRWI